LIFPFFHLKADFGAGGLLAVDDALQERVGAAVGNRKHLLAFGAGLCVERLARRHEDRLGGIDGETRLGPDESIRDGIGERGRRRSDKNGA
jgi:hypothetical protein